MDSVDWGRPTGEGIMRSPDPTSQDRARLAYFSNIVLVRTQLAATPTVVFTVPQKQVYVMRGFSVFNSDGAASHTATLRLVPYGGANTSANDYWETTIPARTNSPWTLEEVLPGGYQIVAYADVASKLNLKINAALLVQQ